MKKFSTIIIMAIALVLGLAYCKKQETPDTPDADVNWVRITMRVEGGGRNMDTLYPGSGAVVYKNGDIIYVGNSGKFRGKLEYQNGLFSGVVCDPEPTDYLHFYYLSGLTPVNALPDTLYDHKDTVVANYTIQFKINIADQTGGLPVISCGHSTTKYINEKTAYTCMLENQCGLVKFKLCPSPKENTPVTISRMKTTATVIFDTLFVDNDTLCPPGIIPTNETGVVTLHQLSGTDAAERWAILLPQDSVPEATLSYTMENDKDTTQTISLPAITPNSFYNVYHGIPVKSL